MDVLRRAFLAKLGCAVALGSAAPLASFQEPGQQPTNPRPRGSDPPRPPEGRTNRTPFPVPPSDKEVLRSDQQGLRKDVTRLLELAQDLKKEVDKTDATRILSLSIFRKAEEIEKLAKQIKTLAKG